MNLNERGNTMKRYHFLTLITLAACVGVQNNGNGTRSGSPVDIAPAGGGGDDSGGQTDDTGGGDTGSSDTGWSDTGWNDTGGWTDTGSTDTGSGLPTEEFAELGSAVGDAVVEGDTTGLSDDFTPTCGGSGYGDAIYLWTSPSAGLWSFDLSGSSFDTALAVIDPGSESEIACDDDGGDSATSLVTVELARNEQVAIVVDGYGGEGYFTLAIRSE